MMRRRMRYLQEEQKQQHERLGDNYYNDINSAESGADAELQSDYEEQGQHNNNSTAVGDDSHDMTTTNEPIITAVLPSKVTNTAPSKEYVKRNTQHIKNGCDSMNMINEVSLESIDEQTILSHQLPPRSHQHLLHHCHENNIPVITVGPTLSSWKKTWIDFGEDNVNVVGAISTRQFLIHASTESSTLNVFDTTSSAMLVTDDNNSIVNNNESLINLTLERISCKGGFNCMLHHDSSSSTNNCPGNLHGESSLDPMHFQLKNGETQLFQAVWSPIQEGCVRDHIGLQITTGEGQVRHEIGLVGNARENHSTTSDVDSSNMMKKDEWNGVSVEYSEIREDGSQFDLVVDGVGLTVTEESVECCSIATNGGDTNDLIDSHEVHEIAQMMQNASISPKKASMAAKSLSQLPESRNEEVVNRRHVNANQIVTAQEEIGSERMFAEESRLMPQTSQDFVNGLYMNDKVRHLLDDFDAESTSTIDRRSGRSTPTFGSFSSEEEKCTLSDVSQRLYDGEQIEPQCDTTEEEKTAEKTERGDANVVSSLHENQHSSVRRFSTATSYHYGKVTAELNALMEDVSDDFDSQSESDNESCLSSDARDQTRDQKVGIFSFDKAMSNEENEELNMLPETSIDHSSDWDSSGADMSIDSDLRRNPYKQMSSDLDALMDEFSELEQFAQMQQNYLISPTTHDFQTQLENINEQIDNLTPSPGNAMNLKTPARDLSENRPVLRVKETRDLETASEPPTPKDSAQKCYFYKPPPKENSKPSENLSSRSARSRDIIEQKRVPYKSPFAAVLEAETSFQSIDSMFDGFSSFDGSDCASKPDLDESNSSDDTLLDSSSLDESSISSGETEFDVSNQSSADLNDDNSSLSETSTPVLSQKKEINVAASEPMYETRSEQIALMKSKLSSWKSNTNDQWSKPVVSRAQQHSSPTKIPQPPSTQKLQLKTPAVKSSSMTTSVSTAQKSKPRQYSSPTKIPRLTPSSRKLQLNTPAPKTLDVASLTTLASSTAQKSARMTYGYFSHVDSYTENSRSDSDEAGMSRLPTTKNLKTPTPSRRVPTQLKTPSSISAYEKHVERMRKSRNCHS